MSLFNKKNLQEIAITKENLTKLEQNIANIKEVKVNLNDDVDKIVDQKVIDYLVELIRNKSAIKNKKLNRPFIVCIDGCGGSGKGTIAKRLGDKINVLKIISTDYLYNFKNKDFDDYLSYFN